MDRGLRLVIAAAMGAIALAASLPALAQDSGPSYDSPSYATPNYGTVTVGGAEISVGGGVATLDLPDIKFGVVKSFPDGTTIHKLSNDNDFENNWGGAFSGSMVVPWQGPTALAVSGFWSSFDANDSLHCTSTVTARCTSVNIVDNPAVIDTPATPAGTTALEKTDRDVDNWGVQLEGRYYLDTPVVAPGLMKNNYLALGADVRGIDQNTSIRGTLLGLPGVGAHYGEGLDTEYYGGYAAFGGEYSLPYVSGLAHGWGLRSFFSAHAGIYDASTDYDGAYNAGLGTSRLSISQDKAVFIGGVSFETRKQFTPRTSLSLLTEYEWYSSVPNMKYNDTDISPAGVLPGKETGTHIDSEGALSTRTTLRLNIGLGPGALYTATPPH